MLVKIRIFVVFLLLFQPLDAKKRKQHSTSLASKIENSIVAFMDLIYGAWDGLIYFLPDIQTTPTKKSKKKKSGGWEINYHIQSAVKKFNYLYRSVSDSVQFLKVETKESGLVDTPVESVFSIELLVAEIFEGITRGVVRVVDGFDEK